jgi:glycosyltransferase involved in cell wall biosynthesis
MEPGVMKFAIDGQTTQLIGVQEVQTASNVFSVYPLDMSFALTLPCDVLGADGIPYRKNLGPHPQTITQYALAQWNVFLATAQDEQREAFLAQAYWLLKHAQMIEGGAAGWPLLLPEGRPGLSAIVQGSALSVLLRAYLLTQDNAFLQLILRVFRTFQLDILDGGIASPVLSQEQGLWFEEYACYPASHSLSGMLFALLGLHEYAYLSRSHAQSQATALFERAFSTLNILLPEFDRGFWVRRDLLENTLLTPEQLARDVQLLHALSSLTGDVRCTYLSCHWQRYLQNRITRLRLPSHHPRPEAARMQPKKSDLSSEVRICVPITAFPFVGGMRTILEKIAACMDDSGWNMTYLTQRVGEAAAPRQVQRFGSRWLSPRQFPFVWGYVLTGAWSLSLQLLRGVKYDLILPQDGLFSAAFAAPLARLAGIRVVCIDHGNLAALPSQLYRQERLQSLSTKSWLRRHLEPLLFVGYWPSLQLLARISARFVDQYIIPGVAGDGIEEICYRLGLPASRLTRFVNTIDVTQYAQLAQTERETLRGQRGLAADAIVITTICRLSPEKGLEIALLALDQALSLLSPSLRIRVRFVIAGDGVLRPRLEELILQRGLGLTCVLWGEISHAEAMLLHDLSDIYIYSGTRGGGYSLVMLEAMAAASALIASDVPLANVQMLADGRGLIVPAGDVSRTAQALVRLIEDESLRKSMGQRAREYVSQQNTEQIFRRVWQRTTSWANLDQLLRGRFVERQEGV